MIYLDNAATTYPKPESVYTAMDLANRELGVNVGRGSYALARKASGLISETKNELRKLLNIDISVPVVFSPSITIALNQIANGIEWKKNVTVYVSPYEHNAVARTLQSLSEKYDFKICFLPLIEATMEIDIEKMRFLFAKDKPFAVFCTHVSNVTGYILPVREIFAEAKKFGAITVLDSAQSLGLIETDANVINADFIAFAGHKTLYGPFGIGGFVNVSRVFLNEFITGGTGSDSLNLSMPDGLEAKYEASSVNISAIAGLNAALKALNPGENYKHEKELTEYLITKLSRLKNVKLYLPGDLSKHVGIVSFTYAGMNSDEIGTILDGDYDIAVRTGYHCAPYIHDYIKDKSSLGTVRVGLSRFNAKDDIDALYKALEEIDD